MRSSWEAKTRRSPESLLHEEEPEGWNQRSGLGRRQELAVQGGGNLEHPAVTPAGLLQTHTHT